MVVSAILTLVTAALGPVFAALPSWSIASYFGGVLGTALRIGQSHWLLLGNVFLPVSEMLTLTVAFLGIMAPIAAYRLASWVYRHIPSVAGFGAGAG
jgi:hypothetical protein